MVKKRGTEHGKLKLVITDDSWDFKFDEKRFIGKIQALMYTQKVIEEMIKRCR